jgi:hypothetical protein
MKKTNFLNQLACSAFAVMIAAGFTFGAKAQGYINGDISFVGGATLNGPLASATAFTDIFGPAGTGTLPQVQGSSQTGDYASVPTGTLTAFPVFSFNPPPGSSFPLWTFTVGVITYSFQADPAITIDLQNSRFLDIEGTGTASISGGAYYPTAGTWSIVDTGLGSSPVFTFGADAELAGPPVPEPSVFALLVSFVPIIGAFAYRARPKA